MEARLRAVDGAFAKVDQGLETLERALLLSPTSGDEYHGHHETFRSRSLSLARRPGRRLVRCAGMHPGCSRRPGRSRGILRGPAPRRCTPHRRDVGPSLRQPPDPLRCAVVSTFGESARRRSGMFQQHARDHGQYVHSGRRADRRLHGGLWDRQAAVRDGVSQRIAGQRRVADRRHD